LNLAIAVALLGWFSVETGFVGAMVADGLNNVFGVVVDRWPGIVAASVLVCTICVFGIALVSRAPMLFLPFLSLLLLVVLLLTLRTPVLPPTAISTTKPIGTGISAIVGAYIVGCLIMPDYTRFVRTSRAAVGATMLALGPVYGVMLGTYALAGLATHSTNPSTILLSSGLPTIVGLLLPIGLMQNGIMCLYSSSLATATLARSLSLKITTIALAVVGTALALAGADNLFCELPGGAGHRISTGGGVADLCRTVR
jgi:cytosine permease